ncbi:MAG: type IV toxin-antitoxin system AbiEi family antitoxin domain-containing protein [Mucilaginibacter sp.]
MDINQTIANNAKQPITHQLLMSWLKAYKRPNDKINALKSEGILAPVKKGIYIAGPNTYAGRPENALLANHLLGPSYVSSDSALSFHGLIPERVYSVTSMTTKASRDFNTSIGLFTYIHLPLPYYAFGIHMVRLTSEQYAMIAGPEKAICDKIVSTSGLILRSTVSAGNYLIDNLRIAEDALKGLNTQMMSEWLPNAPKNESLQMVIKLIKSL